MTSFSAVVGPCRAHGKSSVVVKIHSCAITNSAIIAKGFRNPSRTISYSSTSTGAGLQCTVWLRLDETKRPEKVHQRGVDSAFLLLPPLTLSFLKRFSGQEEFVPRQRINGRPVLPKGRPRVTEPWPCFASSYSWPCMRWLILS